MASAACAKAFRAELPPLRRDEVERLARWGEANCSVSVIFESEGRLIWLAAKERLRTRANCMRHVRAVLTRLAVDASRIRGKRWLSLTSEEYVRRAEEEARGQHELGTTARCRPQEEPRSVPADYQEEEDGARTVRLPSAQYALPLRTGGRRGERRAGGIEIIKEK